MPNHAGVLQSLFFPAKLETEGDDAIFNTLLKGLPDQPPQTEGLDGLLRYQALRV